MQELAVVIPTKNRPEKLERCLAALAGARSALPFEVYVCDSTTDPERRRRVEEICARHDFARLEPHAGTNVAAARNHCAKVARAELLVNVDDDIYVEPDAIVNILRAYRATSGPRMVAGSVRWGDEWSTPVKMRVIGYGRGARPDEKPDFFIGAFFIYPRAYALAKPWNDRIKVSDDQYMGALLRSADVQILFEPTARAVHDDQHNSYGIAHLDSHIYANLFDVVIANPQPMRALCYEVLGFAFAVKLAMLSKTGVRTCLAQWYKGHADLIRDWRYLKTTVASPLPQVA